MLFLLLLQIPIISRQLIYSSRFSWCKVVDGNFGFVCIKYVGTQLSSMWSNTVKNTSSVDRQNWWGQVGSGRIGGNFFRTCKKT